MKTILLLVSLLFFTASAQSQNLVLTNTGGNTVLVKSNMACTSIAQLEWKITGGITKDTVFLLAAGSSRSFVLLNLLAPSTVQAQSIGVCAQASAQLYISIPLAVAPSMVLSKTAEGIQLKLSGKGIVEKSSNGVQFYPMGEYDKLAIDRVPYPTNYYRLIIAGNSSPVYRMQYEGRVYAVYTLLGQLTDVTRNVDRYRGGRYIIL